MMSQHGERVRGYPVFSAAVLCATLVLLVAQSSIEAGPYVTEASSVRWSDVSGVRWSDASGVRWADASGTRWNETGGVRWSDASEQMFTEAAGVRWTDVSGVRWSDASGLQFGDAASTGNPSLDIELLKALSILPDGSGLDVIVTYFTYPSGADFARLHSLGIHSGTRFRRLPMLVVNATRSQIEELAGLPNVRSVFTNQILTLFDDQTRTLAGVEEAVADPDLAMPGGGAPSGSGVTIAVLDTGVDALHPDLPFGSKVVQNVRLQGSSGTAVGYVYPNYAEGLPNTDLVMGHGTFVASVAAGSGAASGGLYRGVAPGASILALSAGDLFILNMLEGFDYILDRGPAHGVRVVNCSWGTTGWFDPDDPINVATRMLYDSGVSVVFAAGNHGPSQDTLNPFAAAPWVIGVGSTRKDGRLSSFSSRGIYQELITRPLLVAPGEGIVAAAPVALNAVNGVIGVADPIAGGSVRPEYAAYYTVSSGTSFAAPHVAGVIALLLERAPALTPSQIHELLQKTATPILTEERSEVGAGLLDAWAALTQAVDPVRPFGTHILGWLDQRPYAIAHLEPLVSEGYLPSGASSLTLTLAVPGNACSWGATLAWGTLPGLNDIDLVVRDDAGRLLARSESFNAPALFGRSEGVQLTGRIPQQLSVEIYFKAGGSVFGQSFYLREEAAAVVPTGFTDLGSLSKPDRDTVARALGEHVLVGRGDRFEAGSPLTRAELARALALTSGLPQRVPSDASFFDTGTDDPDFPYVESVAGTRSRRVLIAPREEIHCVHPPCPTAFAPGEDVTRLESAVALVRAADLEGEALERTDEELPLADAEEIPLALRGYVAVALERGLIEAYAGSDGPVFKGGGSVPRLDAARSLLNLLALRREGAPSLDLANAK